MPVWRCPHCATPQAEASRCWVCRRSTTSCVTCRHYRRAIASGLGLCGLDAAHPVVAATDVQPCWVGVPASEAGVAVGAGPLDAFGNDHRLRPTAPRQRTFVPVEAIDRRSVAGVAVLDAANAGLADATGRADARPSEPERANPERAGDDRAEPGPAGEPARAVDVVTVAVAAGKPIPGRWWLWGDPDPWPER